MPNELRVNIDLTPVSVETTINYATIFFCWLLINKLLNC
jgi:hypothetical protein